MNTYGRHLLLELHGCDVEALDSTDTIDRLLKQAAEAAGATVVGALFHTFSPQGVSGVVLVEESHFSVHTWPEHGYAAIDMFTCGGCDLERARDVLATGLSATRAEIMMVERGLDPSTSAMRVARHQRWPPTSQG